MERVTEAQLGERLTEAVPNKLKIFLHTACRTALAVVISLAGSGGIHGIGEWFTNLRGIFIFFFLWIVFLAIGLYPLKHLKDSLVFYEYGICYHGINYLFSELGSVRFRDFQSGLMVHNMMDTDLRTFDVTFLERPKRQYNRAYMNQVAEQSSQSGLKL